MAYFFYDVGEHVSLTIEQILAQYRKQRLADANEAATRLKVIDHVLRDVLQWTDDDINPEERVSEDGKTTFSDYVLRTANCAMVVEAKKIGAAFDVGIQQRKQKLTNSFVQGAVGEAIVQARDYARKLGIDFAVVTNGATWILFPAQRHDQVAFSDSYALIYPGLESILKEDFQEFFGLLGRENVIGGSLELALLGRQENQFGARKLSQAFPATNKVLSQNPVFPLIEEGVVKAFSDSIGDLPAALLEKCYVSSPETMKFDARINMQLTKRDHLFRTQPIRPMKHQDADALRKKLQQSVLQVKPLAVLLLGTVGAGKTTFLQYTRNVKAASLFKAGKEKQYPHWIYVDLRDCEEESAAVDFIYRRIKAYMLTDSYFKDYKRSIEPAYREEVSALRSGPLHLIANNKEKFDDAVTGLIRDDYEKLRPYVDKLLSHAARWSAVFLVIDNVDQFEEEDTQSRLFKEAIALGHKLGVNLVLAMRGATYALHRNSPTFDAFDFDPLQIDSPKVSSVLSKRFSLAKQLLEGKKGQFIAENGALVKVDNAAQIIELVQASVLGTEIGTRIEVLAGDDVRLALRMTREFLEYGYSNPGKALETFRASGSYVLPKHEAFRAILLGNRSVYSEEYSPIWNPFDSKLSISSAQLLRLYVLTAIVNFGSVQSFRHIDGTSIVENMRKIGFGDSVTLRILTDLCTARFLHTASHSRPTLNSSFSPTRLGGYVVRDFLSYFAYLENVMFDTFISDNRVWERLRDLSHQIEGERNTIARIKLRISRVKEFVEYLKGLYLPLQIESQKRSLVPEWCSNPFLDSKGKLAAELSRVLESAENNYGIRKENKAPAARKSRVN